MASCLRMAVYAIRHADRLANTKCSLTVAAFAVCIQSAIHPVESKALTGCMASCLRMAHCLRAKKAPFSGAFNIFIPSKLNKRSAHLTVEHLLPAGPASSASRRCQN